MHGNWGGEPADGPEICLQGDFYLRCIRPAGRACLLPLPSDTTVHLQIRSCARALAVATALALFTPAASGAAEMPISRMTFTTGWATFGLVLPPQSART